MAQLRSALFLQAAITALFGLTRGGGGAWTIATMVVAAAAVFVGAALQPTPEMRTAAIAFEGVAVAFGVVGLVVGHYVPGTIIAGGALVQLLGPNAGLAFTGTPKATLQVFGAPEPPEAPVAAPVEAPAAAFAPPVEAPAATFAPPMEAPAAALPPSELDSPFVPATVLDSVASVLDAPAYAPPAAPEAPAYEPPVVPAQAVPLTAPAAVTVLPLHR